MGFHLKKSNRTEFGSRWGNSLFVGGEDPEGHLKALNDIVLNLLHPCADPEAGTGVRTA